MVLATMSHSTLNLVHDLHALAELGVGAFRLSPHSCDMVEVSRLFSLGFSITNSLPVRLVVNWKPMALGAPFSNGYLHDKTRRNMDV